MPRALATVLIAACTAWLCAPVALAGGESLPDPQDTSLSPSQRLEALIERVRRQHGRLQTLEAEFIQRKESSLLLEPSVAEGVFSYAAPDRVRWEYVKPDPISLVIQGDEMTTWYRDLEQAERMQIGRHSQQILKYLGAGSSMETLLQYFTVSLRMPGGNGDLYRLDLDPRYQRISHRIREMSVWIDPVHFLPVRLRYVEPDGDSTEIEFNEFRLNSELPADRFELDLPGSVKVRQIHPGRQAGAP